MPSMAGSSISGQGEQDHPPIEPDEQGDQGLSPKHCGPWQQAGLLEKRKLFVCPPLLLPSRHDVDDAVAGFHSDGVEGSPSDDEAPKTEPLPRLNSPTRVERLVRFEGRASSDSQMVAVPAEGGGGRPPGHLKVLQKGGHSFGSLHHADTLMRNHGSAGQELSRCSMGQRHSGSSASARRMRSALMPEEAGLARLGWVPSAFGSVPGVRASAVPHTSTAVPYCAASPTAAVGAAAADDAEGNPEKGQEQQPGQEQAPGPARGSGLRPARVRRLSSMAMMECSLQQGGFTANPSCQGHHRPPTREHSSSSMDHKVPPARVPVQVRPLWWGGSLPSRTYMTLLRADQCILLPPPRPPGAA